MIENIHQSIHYLWAKTDKDGSWHPLICHMIDTSCVAEYFWRNILGTSARKRISAGLNLDEESSGKWIPFFAGLHDIGKASEVFQSKDEQIFNLLVKNGIPQSRIRNADIHHTLFGSVVIPELLSSIIHDHFPSFIAQLLGGHHGVFPIDDKITSAKNSVASWEEGLDCWRQIRKSLIDCLVKIYLSPKISTPSIDKWSPDNMATILLAGLVSVSDWIASNEDFFPYRTDIQNPDEYLTIAKKHAQNAVNKMHWGGDSTLYTPHLFETLFPNIGKSLRPVQQKINDMSDTSPMPRLIIIEVPMGEGKTEAALLMQDHWRTQLQQRGAYFALPTMATSNQMFQRVKEFLGNAYPKEYVNYHLLHSHAMFSDEYSDIKMQSVDLDRADKEDGTIIADEWFCKSKRGLLAPFAVGTVDQTLLSVLQTRHGFVRLFGLADKTIIFDEVHAYDTYMTTLFERLLEWLGKMGTTVVILSATLSRSRLISLASAYSGQNLDAPQIAPYPRISWIDNKNEFHCETVSVSKDIELQINWLYDDLDGISRKLSDLLSDGGCVSWICNTVNRAQDVYKELKRRFKGSNIEIDLFHARYPFIERDIREKRSLGRFGKDGKRPKQSILVATQVIEQSLDLDFDMMISELAPIDLILQRSGRMHRHPRQRHPKLSERILYIIKPSGHDEANPNFGHTVYDEWIMLRSWLSLSRIDKIKIPDDIENLIENVYGEQHDDGLSPENEARLNELKEIYEKKMWEKESKAKSVALKKPDEEDLMNHWNQELDEVKLSPLARPEL